MDRLEADLRYFLRELEGEDDPFRRRLVQLRIVATQRAILALMTEEREELDRQHSNMERAPKEQLNLTYKCRLSHFLFFSLSIKVLVQSCVLIRSGLFSK